MPFPSGTLFPGATTFPGETTGPGPGPVPGSSAWQGPEWVLYVRDNRTLLRVAQLDDYQDAELVARFNAVGTWTVQLHRDVFHRIPLEPWHLGLEAVRRTTIAGAGTTVLSGPLTSLRRDRNDTVNTVTLTGVDDTVWLANRLASPQPASPAPPYSITAHDVHTGTASTVLCAYVNNNGGPGAIGARQVPGLLIATDPVIGSVVTGRARWHILLELLQGLAISGGNLGFKLTQSGAAILFTVYQPTDKSATIHFSVELGNLAGYTYELTRPESSYVFVGGGDELTNRIILEAQDGPSQSRWGRVEQFRDRRDTLDVTELGQAAGEHLAENGEKTSLSITPIDLTGQAFGTHYQLGDRVSVVIDGTVISEIVREVRIKLTPDGPQTVTPTIGTTGEHHSVRLFKAFRDVQQRLANLERR